MELKPKTRKALRIFGYAISIAGVILSLLSKNFAAMCLWILVMTLDYRNDELSDLLDSIEEFDKNTKDKE